MLKNQSLVAKHLEDRIDPLNKGIAHLEQPIGHGEIVQRGWNLLREDLSLPAAVLYEDKLRHNLEWMRQFTAAYGAKHAPHGKTSMAPRLFAMQLEAGAWGITLATAHQTQVAYEHGVRRVLMANQLIGRENMAIVARLLRDPEFEFYCLVDSAVQVDQLGGYFAQAGQRVNILIELGVAGGRAGVRDGSQLEAVLEALARWPQALVLSGIEVYEGILGDEESVLAFLQRAVEVTNQVRCEEALPALADFALRGGLGVVRRGCRDFLRRQFSGSC